MSTEFLVTSRKDMEERGWDQLDFVYVNGDAYVDHPGFAAALIGRMLEARGYRVGLISQPDWHDVEAFKVLGKPRLGILITAGNLDSMLSEKTAAKKIRNTDSYSPGGKAGRRPERATIVYANRAKPIKTCPSLSAVLKRVSDALLITIIGPIRCGIPCCWTVRPIS